MTRYICNHCRKRKFYNIRRGKKRCKSCGYEFKNRLGKLGLSRKKWRELIFWFLLEQPIRGIERQTRISHYSTEKAVKTLRLITARDVPGIFSGTVEVDETYLGGQKKNKRKSQLKKEPESRRGWGTAKQPVFGILTRKGKVFAKLVDDTEARDLLPIITKKVKAGSNVCSDTWRAYTGLAAKGYVHRTVEHGEKEYVQKDNRKNHINGLEGFWGYLKRKLAAKGGIRRKYISLFLGEYVWRYNYRSLTIEKQRERLLKKVTDFSG